ncbi:two-component sensor histidine kinase [Lederbergia ruris]|uniref:histidine kinase n=1 Tax=Lederbergia ruris TaxID=217495 RepID=A0ABQ4KFM5_9BACI|nr:HAMP domain-containing sensor histidine kinase [Lederbergia ruris]GIN56707.1 two-component sensor histidine kinase [Lederbergia ruris]
MKWKLTGRYILSIVLVVTLVVFINIFIMLALLIAQSIFDIPIFQGNKTTPEDFARQFQENITVVNHDVTITESGKKALIEKNAWIQILDENGKVMYSYRTPKGIMEKYTPADIVQTYKYQEIANTTVFVGGKKEKSIDYSYFIGIENPGLNRYAISFDNRDIYRVVKVVGIILVIDVFIALLIGYFFSKRLTQPLHALIYGIKRLANKDYTVHYEPKGVYKDVFHNVNFLSNQLTANEKERKKLEIMREDWIGNISHDIKTPLASIQGYAELIKDQDYHFSLEEIREYAEIIEQKSLYIKEVMEDLNLSTRLKNKALSLNKKTVNLVALLRNIVIDILNDPKYSNRNIVFHVNQENIPVEIDEILFRRAINNLLYNAMVHNDENVQIDVLVEKQERTHIMIKDDGKGIRKEELERIFDRYYRGTNTGDAHRGSGLGMAIAKDIIQEHNGELTINSEIGHGTTIDIKL